MYRLFVSVFILGISLSLTGKVTTVDSIAKNPGMAGGVYYAYPISEDDEVVLTATPKDYEPFYVSHYGRHGSRYLINDADYKNVLDWLRKAYYNDNLTDRGRLLKEQMGTIWEEARGRGGELTPLGNRQHKAIAKRLYKANPEIFEGTPEITAKSTVIMRCAHSMFAFIEGLKEIKPSLEIPRESGSRAMDYLNYHSAESNLHSSHKGEWFTLWKNFRDEKTNPERLMKEIFKDIESAKATVDMKTAMWDLYWIAIDLQNMDSEINLFDLFTPQELFGLWQAFNFNMFACNSSYPAALGTITDNAKNLLRNIVETADEYVAGNKNGATLRFGHDGNIIPLTALMQLEDCWSYEWDPNELANSWADYFVSPMAANLQMIFYRNKKDKDDVLVKILLNEQETAINREIIDTDCFPYYKWTDLRETLNNIIETPSSYFLPIEWTEADGLDDFIEEENKKFQ